MIKKKFASSRNQTQPTSTAGIFKPADIPRLLITAEVVGVFRGIGSITCIGGHTVFMHLNAYFDTSFFHM